jgi:hypothetical protein
MSHFVTAVEMGHVLIWGLTYDTQFQHWGPSSGTGGPEPELKKTLPCFILCRQFSRRHDMTILLMMRMLHGRKTQQHTGPHL